MAKGLNFDIKSNDDIRKAAMFRTGSLALGKGSHSGTSGTKGTSSTRPIYTRRSWEIAPFVTTSGLSGLCTRNIDLGTIQDFDLPINPLYDGVDINKGMDRLQHSENLKVQGEKLHESGNTDVVGVDLIHVESLGEDLNIGKASDFRNSSKQLDVVSISG